MGKRAVGRSTVGILIVVAGLLSATACKSSSTDTASPGGTTAGTSVSSSSTVIPVNEGTPKSGGALVFGIDAEPNGMSVVGDQFATSAQLIVSAIFESLTVFDKDHNPQPYLAESLTPSNLASKWTIKLKPNIKFHDGTPLTAEVAKANLDAQRKGLAAVAMKVISAINVVDAQTFEVEMTQPWASFPGFLASQEGMMASQASLTADDVSTHPVGTGPFIFDRWDRGTKVVTKKNPDYWQAGKPYLDQLEFRILTDPASRANALESGEVNVIFTDDPQTMVNHQNKSGYKALIDQSGDAQSIVMNQASAPFDNVNARKAVVLATDSAAVAETFGSGVLKATDQPFSDKTPYHESDSHYGKFDLEAAKKATQQYTTETGQPLEFTLTTFTGGTNLQLAQLLQEQWAKAGIKAQIAAIDQATAIGQIIVGKTQAVLTPNFGYPDPDWYYAFWHSDFTGPVGTLSINFPHMKIAALDEAITQGRVSLLPEQRRAAYRKATQILNDNFVYVWVYRYVAALIAADNVHGLRQAEEAGFSSQNTKPYYQDLWLSR